MTSLEHFVAERNSIRELFGKPKLTIGQDNQIIAQLLQGELSPEILTCDGEVAPHIARLRHKHLISDAEELVAQDPSIRFYELEL